ncbi:unnamed protein product [Lactuca virosa]|uniref:Transmembrane protein n=1 Tax=Lactuca virosa TaxID=75947 RepID=A0AAU9MEL8_9ASTR|nr:unnamed protein product [Lactuca virosa]
MTEISRRSSLRFLLFFSSISLQFFAGFSEDSNSKDVTKVDAHSSSSSKKGSTILITCITIGAFAVTSIKNTGVNGSCASGRRLPAFVSGISNCINFIACDDEDSNLSLKFV